MPNFEGISFSSFILKLKTVNFIYRCFCGLRKTETFVGARSRVSLLQRSGSSEGKVVFDGSSERISCTDNRV